jgi:hypothetical protein
MPTFENGWICRKCWTANRERDGSCYRCHAERPDYSEPVPIFSQRPAPAAAPTPAPEPAAPRFAAVASEPEPAPVDLSACAGCGEVLLPEAKFCVRCGLSTAKDARPARRPTPPIASEAPARVTFTPPAPAQAPQAASVAEEEESESRNPLLPHLEMPHLEMPHVEMPRMQMPRVTMPKPSAAGMTESLAVAFRRVLAAIAQLPPVAAVIRAASAVAGAWRRVLAFRQQRTEVWLFVGWLGLMGASTVLLFAYAGVGRGDVAGQLLNGMLVVLALSVLSALTAALTITLLKPMRGDMAEMNERLRLLSERLAASRPSSDRTEVVKPMRPREETQRAS